MSSLKIKKKTQIDRILRGHDHMHFCSQIHKEIFCLVLTLNSFRQKIVTHNLYFSNSGFSLLCIYLITINDDFLAQSCQVLIGLVHGMTFA